ncbi:glycosyltransferase [Bacteroides salyersiae]|uniref:glycosyltransferase n=1 Tax=Bacteroides salyersiae TaxID=291644 RepID=UPI001B8DA38B|nr:glycosyltransferase family 2 protein [Bacteroides salyersiae]
MKMKVSFIIPVYKVENYLDECVQSILTQTYKNYEILLIDDGSPDDSPAKCDKWAKIDSRVRALHKQNGGLSDARNYGLKHAEGDYVIFMDGDDFWRHKDDLEKIVMKAVEYPNVSFIGFNCAYYYPNSNNFIPWVEYANELSKPVEGDRAVQILVASGTFPMSACLKLIKLEILKNNNIEFKKGQIHEDIPWFINLLETCGKCLFVNEYIYAYRQNVIGSITNSINERSFNSLLDIVKTELNKIDTRNISRKSKDALRSFLAYELSILMMEVNILPDTLRKGARVEIQSLMWLFSYKQNPKVRKVAKAYSLFGFTITEHILRIYNWYRCRRNKLEILSK